MKATNRIGTREVRALKPGEIVWDGFVTGFGARRQTGPTVVYVLKYRTTTGRQRFHRIGRHGSPWTPETARNEAIRLLSEIAKGGDPTADKMVSRSSTTIAGLCDLYLADAEAGRLLTRRKIAKKESTLISDRGRISRHIKPILGRMAVAAVTTDDVEAMMHAVAAGTTAARAKTKPRGLSVVRGGRGVATRTVGLLGAIFTYAIRKKLRADNPVRGVMRFADGRRERRLTDLEYRAIGRALENAVIEDMHAPMIAATKFMTVTGEDQSELGQMRPHRVADSYQLRGHQLSGAMQDLYRLLLDGLDSHKSHRWAAYCFADCRSINLIVFLPPDIRLHVSRRYEPHVVTQFTDLLRPVCRCRACLHADKARLQLAEPGQHF
jgi:hypothetical protein